MQLRMWVVLLAVAVVASVGCKVEVPADKEFAEFRDVAVDVDVAVGADGESDAAVGSDLAVGTDAVDGSDAADAEDADAVPDAAEVNVAVDAAEVDVGTDVAEVDVGTDVAEVEVAPDVAEVEVAQPCNPADCNDSNDCTVETCDIAKGCVSSPNTASCSDGDACTVGDACKGGACLPGAVTACDDGNGCTSDKCNKALGCVYLANSLTCTDGDACTLGGGCKDGACLPGTACDDGNGCTNDSCDKSLGCVYLANSLTCTDGDACTVGDVCKAAGCFPGETVKCDDGNPCTTDSCDPAKGCVAVPNSNPCDDGSPCTCADQCSNGTCKSGANTCTCANDGDCAKSEDGNLCNGTLFCDKSELGSCGPGKCCTTSCKAKAPIVCDTSKDGPCKVSACVPLTGQCVTATKPEGTGCDADGSVCTGGDACKGGACLPGAVTKCDDGNPCTTDSCDPAKGCVAVPNSSPCDDGIGCTCGDKCSDGKCKAGVSTCTCASDSDCAKSEDGNLCNGTMFCDLSEQANCPPGMCCPTECKLKPGSPVVCDTSQDGPCKVSACVPMTGKCVTAPKPEGTGCDADGSVCTGGDACKGGACLPGAVTKCDDANPCTSDSCDKAQGCVYAANSLACTDGDACTVGDGCKGGVCLPGAVTKCDDGNSCSSDSCDKNQGCVYAANSLGCTDGDACTDGDTCANKVCAAGKVKVCDDANACTDDSCIKTSGCVSLPNSATCTDSDSCTNIDVCAAGKCVAGQPAVWESMFSGVTLVRAGRAVGDGTYVLAGEAGKKPWRARLDGAGKVLWQISGKDWQFHSDVRVLANGLVFATGACCGLGALTLTWTDMDGNETGTKSFSAGEWSSAEQLHVLANGNILVAGPSQNSSGQRNAHVVLVNASGNPLWENQYNMWGDGQTHPVALNAAGHFAIASRIPPEVSVFQYSSGGSQLAAGPKFGGAKNSNAAAMVESATGGWLIAGDLNDAQNPTALTSDGWVAKLDAKGAVVWQTKAGSIDGSGEQFAGIQETSDGGAVIVGARATESNAEYPWVVRVDAVGKMLWQREFKANAPGTARKVVVDAEGRLLVVGSSKGIGWMARLAPSGESVCDGGPCAGKTQVACDDGNPCTLDGCDNKTGCTHANGADQLPCVDSKSCFVQQKCLSGKCQGGKDKLFVKSLSGGGAGTIQTVHSLPDGGSVVSGGFGNDSCFVKRLDNAGEGVWDNTFACSSPSAVPAALVDGGTTMWQVSGNAFGCCPTGEVRSFSLIDGKSIWKRKVVGPNDCAAIAAHPAGGAVIGCVSGITFRTDGSPTEFSKTTAIWWNQLGPNDVIRAVRVLPDGQVISAGRINGVGFVQRLDDKGALVWKTTLDQVSCDLIDGVSVLDDGSILAFGQGGSGTVGSFHRLNSAGNVIVSKAYPNCGNYGCFHDAVQVASGQVVVAGAQDGSAALRWMTTDGDIAATKKWTLGTNAIFWDIEPLGNSGYLLAGEYIQSLLRVDSFGNDACSVAGACASKAVGDCDDGNPCTGDWCDAAHNGCYHSNLANSSPCGLGKYCDGKGTCATAPAAAPKGMAYIPAGTFMIGCVPADAACGPGEKPQKEITLSPYYIDITEVTVDAYKACVSDGACGAPMVSGAGGNETYNWGVPGHGNYPINGVDWAQSSAYCKWKGGRLPTSAEWEKAARGGCEKYANQESCVEGKISPWGNELATCTYAVMNDGSGAGCGVVGSKAVGTKPDGNSPYGLSDMMGNVWEWVSDWGTPNFLANAPLVDPTGQSKGTERVLRGGNWGNPAILMRSSHASQNAPDFYSNTVGFRCAKSYP